MVTIFVVFCCKFVVYAHFLQLASLDEVGNNLFHFCNHLLPKFVTFATATNLLIFNGLTSFLNIGYKVAKFWNEKDRGVVGRAKNGDCSISEHFCRWPPNENGGPAHAEPPFRKKTELWNLRTVRQNLRTTTAPLVCRALYPSRWRACFWRISYP